MNFNLLFSTVSVLSFIIEFAVDNDERQDYFLFGGLNKSAHLFRENSTLYLHLTHNHGEKFSIYNTSMDEGNFNFSWNGFAVDGKKMTLQKSVGDIKQLEFEHFTFISPIVDIFDLECSNQAITSCSDRVNYWYFLIMMVAVGLAFDSKTMAKNFIKGFLKNTEGDHVTMDRISSLVKQGENINESEV